MCYVLVNSCSHSCFLDVNLLINASEIHVKLVENSAVPLKAMFGVHRNGL